MQLDVAPQHGGVILELPAHRLERVADRDVNVAVGVMFIRTPRSDKVLSWDRDLHANAIVVAPGVMTMRPFDGNVARLNAVEKPLELLRAIANSHSNCIRRADAMKSYL